VLIPARGPVAQGHAARLHRTPMCSPWPCGPACSGEWPMPHGGPQALAQALYLAHALHGDGEAAAVLGDATSGCSIPA
jgi:hypothetical protein